MTRAFKNGAWVETKCTWIGEKPSLRKHVSAANSRNIQVFIIKMADISV